MWNWCWWSADWFRQSSGGFMWKRRRHSAGWLYANPEIFHKIAVNRVRVDFVKVQGIFCKIDIHKVWSSFAKLSFMNCGLISPKFEGEGFAKFTSRQFVAVESDGRGDLGWRGHLPVQGSALELELIGKIKKWKINSTNLFILILV